MVDIKNLTIGERAVFSKLFQCLKNNNALNMIFKYLCKNKDITESAGSFFSLALAGPDNYDLNHNLSYNSQSSFKDCRFKSMKVRNFRGIGYGMDEESYIGVDFRAKDSQGVASMIILGSNGTGKTSLFSAIECGFTDSVSIARKRGFDLSQVADKFIRNIFISNKTTSSIQIDTNEGVYVWPSANTPMYDLGISAKAFFCSDALIEIFEREPEQSIEDYIFEQLGLKRVLLLSKLISNCRTELESALRAKVDGKTDVKIIDELKDKTAEFIDNLFNEFNLIHKELTRQINEQRQSINSEINDILTELLDEINFWDGMDVAFKELFPDSKILTGLNTKFTPRMYFNDFRFKIFMISISVAIAFSYMRKYSLCFPLVFDDVFNVSDFLNRSTHVRQYINKVFEIYQKKLDGYQPLQLILFTQDEVVANAAYKGVIDANRFCNSDIKVSLCKMFYRKYMNKTDVISLNTDVSVYKQYDVLRKNF